MPRLVLAQQLGAAEALFEEGRQALAAGDLNTACAKLRASEQLDPAAGTRANLADCEERRGHVATAWAVYRSALDKVPAGDPRVAILQGRINKLAARLPTLVLVLAPHAPKETTVREGDAKLGEGATYGVALPLDPGVHHLVITAPARISAEVEVTLVEGKSTTLTVEPGANTAPAAALSAMTPPRATPPQVEDVPSSSASPGPWIVGGLGLALVVVGTATGALVLHDKSVSNANCKDGPPPTCRDQTGLDAASAVRTLGPVTTVALVLGAAGLTAGGVWLGVRRSDTTAERFGISPTHGGAWWRMEASS